jgi:SAM-dependent methyltransferase
MSKKIGILNYLKDLFKYDVHRKIRKKIHSYSKSKKDLTYDYSGGYFYQNSERINLSGLRSSKKRTLNYSINEILKNKDILDVGTNSGFLLFELENNFKSILGIDYNQKTIKNRHGVLFAIKDKKAKNAQIDNRLISSQELFSKYFNKKHHDTGNKREKKIYNIYKDEYVRIER